MAIGRLDSASTLLPDTLLFLYMYVRKEAVLSSMIEGTQSSISDLLLFELDQVPGVPLDDVREVSNYVAALNHGLSPLCLRLLKEIHSILLSKGRGSHQSPGDFRRSQNWIGGTRPGNAIFVPPPPEKVLECMGKFEQFLHDQPEHTPVLLKAALAHVQFETIHPFLDGNGRLGRLLITLLLCEQKALREPNWEAWLDFFAEAVIITADQAVDTTRQLTNLSDGDRNIISGLGRAAASTLQVHRALLERPIATAGWLAKKTTISPATVNKCLNHLESLGIVRELTGRKRNRLYSYSRYIEIMNYGTGLPDEHDQNNYINGSYF